MISHDLRCLILRFRAPKAPTGQAVSWPSRAFGRHRQSATNIAAALSIALALGASISSPACALETNAESRYYYESALEWIKKGKGRAAIVQLRNALQADPDNAEARLMLGKLRLAAGNPEAAEKELRIAIEGAYSDEAEILLGRALIDQLRFEDVIRTVSRDALSDEALQNKLIVLADAFWGLLNLAEVESIYDRILRDWPNNKDALIGKARLQLARNQRGSAEEATEAILTRFPDYVDAWVLRADLAILDRNVERAEESLERALEVHPDHVPALVEQGRLLLQLGRWEEAAKTIKKAKSLQRDNPYVMFLRAALNFVRGEFLNADSKFNEIEEALPPEPPTLLLGTLIKFSLGEYAQAERLLGRYLALRPRHPEARRTLGLIHLLRNNAVATKEVLEPLVVEYPDDSAALHLLSTAYLQLRQHGLASRMLQQILEQGRIDAEDMAREGLARLSQDAGIGGWRPQPVNPILPAGLAEEMFPVVDLLQAGQLEEARARVRDLKRLYPDNPFMLTMEGVVLFQRGNRNAARASFERAILMEPEFLAALDNLDRLDRAAEQPSRIEDRLRDLLLRRPRSELLILRLANLLAQTKGVQSAIEFLEDRRVGFVESLKVARALIDAHLSIGSTTRPGQILEELLITHADNLRALTYIQRTFSNLSSFDPAVEVARRLIVLEPDQVNHRLALAQALVEARRQEEAREVLIEARDREPANTSVVTGLIGLSLDVGETDRAIELAKSMELYDEVASSRLHGHVLIKIGRPEEAVTILSEAYRKSGRSDIAIDLFFALRRAGDLSGAIESLEAHLKQSPGDVKARHALASSFTEIDDYKRAMEQYQVLIETERNDALALNNLAWIRDRLDYDDALGYAERAYRLAPDATGVADTYGWLLAKAGDLNSAVPILRRAVGSSPSDPNLRYRLAYALERTGQPEEARRVLNQILGQGQAFEERGNAEALLRTLDR